VEISDGFSTDRRTKGTQGKCAPLRKAEAVTGQVISVSGGYTIAM
jgi:hypothetical protein